MRLRFQSRYFLVTLALLITEVLIAVYCFLRTFTTLPIFTAAISVLLIAFLVEASQYVHPLSVLGWKHSLAAKLVLGNSFAWMDLVMYTTGILFVIIIEIIGKSSRNMA